MLTEGHRMDVASRRISWSFDMESTGDTHDSLDEPSWISSAHHEGMTAVSGRLLIKSDDCADTSRKEEFRVKHRNRRKFLSKRWIRKFFGSERKRDFKSDSAWMDEIK
jgi:hypothetical protein